MEELRGRCRGADDLPGSGRLHPHRLVSKAEHGKAVPTWNYVAVHAYGRLEVVHDETWLLAHVSEISDRQEAPYAVPWSTADAPDNYMPG